MINDQENKGTLDTWKKRNQPSNLSRLPGTPLSFGMKETSAFFIGHSTVLVHLDEQNFLTDPYYRNRLGILKRHAAPGIAFQNLPALNFLLISHGHLDHMDLATLSRFPRHLPVVVPEKLEGYLYNLGFVDVRPLSWGEKTRIGSLVISALPVKHFPGRSLCETLSVPQSYLIQGTKAIFFGGDSGLTETFRQIGDHYSVDLAFLPIGSYAPALFRQVHMSPEDAFEAMEMLRTKRMVPIHWGAFRLSLESILDPPQRFLNLLITRKMNPHAILLQPGGKIQIE
jgi:L-ascorbate metabolism protein UlaG (beta-lactamase superfamily)